MRVLCGVGAALRVRPLRLAATRGAVCDPVRVLLLDEALGGLGWALMDAENLRKLPFLGWVGALPLDLRDFIASKPKLGDTLKPMPNERALLSFLVSRIAILDPDVIVGHNICGFDMDVLLHRIAHNNVPVS